MKLTLVYQKIKVLFLSLFLFVSMAAFAQSQKTISGTVLSAEDNMPLPGASVIVKGATIGVSTDFDGKFSLTVNDTDTTLRISYLGFQTKEVAITSGPITVVLEVDQNLLDEVVVVGYGTQLKSDLVGSVAKTDLSKATATPTADVTEMLRGRIAGLQVDVGGGTLRPGGSSDVLLRGSSSFQGNTGAIYVVDGIIREGGIEDINQDDIKSIEVLKDASAQAIYGGKGSNGVILVTTKRGNANKVSVSYHGFLTSKKLERNFDVYSGQEFAQLKREADRSNNASDEYSDDAAIFSDIELNSIANNEFVDWEDELVSSGIVNSHSISLVGGSDKTKVYGSLNYFKEEGIIPTSSYTRKNLRLNVDQEITDKIAVRFDVNILNDDIERAANVNVITTSPLGKAYNDDGSIKQYPSGEEGTAFNPLWNLNEQDDDEKGNDYVINFIPTYQITDNLKYQLTTSLTRKTSERARYQSSLSSSGDDVRGRAIIDNQLREAFFVENILNYDKKFNEDHKFNLTLAQTIDENKYSRTYTEATGFPNESLGYDGITSAIGGVTAERVKSRFRNLSFMARARYNLLDKYLITGTVRRDGSSVNAKDYKWTTNPAVAFAWKMQNESFLMDVEQISELKLRVSYGSLINALSISNTSLFEADVQNYIFGSETASGYAPKSALPNLNLEHERISTLNIGLDFSVFNRLLIGTVQYYDARTTNLLLKRDVPPTTGYDFTYFNAGELQNKGLELSLTANLIDKDDFKWAVSTNWSNNKNKLLSLYEDGNGDELLEDRGRGYYVGQSTNVIRDFQFDGIWQVGEDYANSAQSNPDSTNPQPDLRPGDIRVKDTNGLDEDGNLTGLPDGKITDEDRVFIDPNPDWFGSLSTNLEYKGFDLYVDFYASEGAMKRNPFLSEYNNGGTLTGKLNGVKVPYYTPENPSTTFPRANSGTVIDYLGASAIKDASYVRLRTISLGYTLSEAVSSKLNLDQIKFYITGTNLFTSTDYIGYSPEVNIRGTFSNADSGYPDATSLTMGVKIKL